MVREAGIVASEDPRPGPAGADGPPASDSFQTSDLLRAVVDTAMAAVITMDERGIITGWGARAEATFGWGAAEVTGRPLVDTIVPPQYREAHSRGIERYRETGQSRVLGEVLELSALHRDGREFPVELRISPAATVAGQTMFIAFVADISERVTSLTNLEAAYREAKRAREEMDGFLSMVVHELRQPLFVIRGYADLLLTEPPALSAEAARPALSAIAEKTSEAAALVDDILLASRLASGKAGVDLARVDLRGIAREVAARARPRASLAAGAIRTDLPPEPVVVDADARALTRILDNLINNAIIYSDGPPEVVIKVAGMAPQLRVSDAGNGIPPEMHDRIFDRFVRVEDRSTRPGSGLGLYISRQLAQRQGASLDLGWSKVGEGSTFCLSYPAAAEAGSTAPAG